MTSTKLVADTVWGCLQAPAKLGERHRERGFNLTPVAFFPRRLPCSFWVIIPKGFVALVNRHGRYVGIWTAGFHWAPPYMSVSHLIPTQYTVYDIPVKECPTQDNVMVTIDVAIIFRVMTEDEKCVYNFCYRLGPDKLDKMLRAFQEEAIRGMVRKRKYNEIYDLMDLDHDKQLDATKRDLNDTFHDYGVHISSLAVTNVHLPHDFAETMAEETIWGTRDTFNKLQQKYKLKGIEIKEVEAKSRQKAQEDLAKFTAEKDSEIASKQKNFAKVEAETAKEIAEITEQQKADVLSIDADSKLLVAQINSKRDIKTSKIRQQGQAEADKVRIEANTYVALRQAEAQKIIKENGAKCTQLNASAEAEAATQCAAQRKYAEKMRALQQLRSLAMNDSVCITGNHKDNIMAQWIAFSREANVFGAGSQLFGK